MDVNKKLARKMAKEIDEDVDNRTFGERLADNVADFGGSWTFIIWFFIIIMVWIGANVFLLFNKGFDPYPFILLNLILSCLASLQAPIIMMSQNRQEAKDRERAKKDFEINMKSTWIGKFSLGNRSGCGRVAFELFKNPGPCPEILLGLDHFHDSQHKFEILVLGIRRTTFTTLPSAFFHLSREELRPLGELGGPLLCAFCRGERVIFLEIRANFLQA